MDLDPRWNRSIREISVLYYGLLKLPVSEHIVIPKDRSVEVTPTWWSRLRLARRII